MASMSPVWLGWSCHLSLPFPAHRGAVCPAVCPQGQARVPLDVTVGMQRWTWLKNAKLLEGFVLNE